MFIKVIHFIVLNETYTCTICSEEGLMKMAENIYRIKQKAFRNKNICCCCYLL